MKKIYFALLVLGTALFASCVQEKSFETIPVGENTVAFVMQGTSTRSGETSTAPATRGITIQMKGVNDENLYLEETIEELNPAPSTRGIPAYTENVGTVYKNNLGVHAVGGNFGDDVQFWNMDKTIYDENGWRYQYDYDGNPWPKDETKEVKFYLRMPYMGSGVSDLTYPSEGKTSFKLVSPLDGSDQQDLLFGYTSLSRNQHKSYLPAGAPVTMYHALTGIKFRNGHPNDKETKTIITKVEVIGLAGSGTATVNADGTVQWPSSELSKYSTETSPFVVEFANPEYVKDDGADNPDGTVGTWDSGFGSSWTSAAADHNLNNSDGSLTFWFIPQAIPNDLTLKVHFTVKTPDSTNGFVDDAGDPNSACHTILLGKLLNDAYKDAGKGEQLTWGPGQLRTYTLKPYDVDVEIEDTISANEKSGLHVANTGNVDEYIRMMVIGNWYDADGNILVGYRYPSKQAAIDAGEVDDPMVLPWYGGGYDLDDDPETDNVDPYGSFDNSFKLAKLGDDRDGKRDDWADASGGYYYTMPIGPGEKLSEAAAGTVDLFKSYTLDPTKIPTIYIAKPGSTQHEAAKGVHLVMEIVVQAIAAEPKDKNGNDNWWLQAWFDATGIEKLAPDYVNKDGEKPNQKYVTYYENQEYAQ